MRVAIVGRGRVGRALARALSASGVDAELLTGRRPTARALARAEIVVLAVPDASIAPTASRIANGLGRRAVVLHTAGARDASELRACEDRGLATGVMHPLVSFASSRQAPSLAGASFVVAGAPRAVRAARAIARAVLARTIVADVHGPTYHAAAAIAANGAAALAAVSIRLLADLGVGARDAERAVGALLASVGHNVAVLGMPDALTGPVRRGDAGTVRAHRRALAKRRAALECYDAIAPAILAEARSAGLGRAGAAAVVRALAESVGKGSA